MGRFIRFLREAWRGEMVVCEMRREYRVLRRDVARVCGGDFEVLYAKDPQLYLRHSTSQIGVYMLMSFRDRMRSVWSRV